MKALFTRRNLTKCISVAMAALVTTLILTGCASQTSSNTSASSPSGASTGSVSSNSQGSATGSNKAHELIVGFDSDPGTLDPFSSNSGARLYMLQGVYETLATNYDGKIHNVLAKEMKEVPGTATPTYDVTIWDDIYDTAGNHFTADDIVWNYQKNLASGNNTDVGYVKSVDKVNDYTVRFTMKDQSIARFEMYVTDAWQLTQAAYNASSDGMSTDPVGTGPYKVTKYQSGALIRYEKNDKYWQSNDKIDATIQQQNIDAYEYHIITETNQLVTGLQAGEIDIATHLDYDTVENFMPGGKSSEGFAVDTYTQPVCENLYLNCSKGSIFEKNVALRQCIMHAVDIDTLIGDVLKGQGAAAHDIGVNANFPDYPTQFDKEDYFKFDMTLAAQELKEAGYKPGDVKLRICLNSSEPVLMKLAQIMQENLSQIGIKLDINAYNNAVYEKNRFDSKAWDLLFDGRAEFMSYPNMWSKLDTRAYSPQVKSECFADDSKLYDLVAKALSKDTTSNDVLVQLHDYNNQMAYARGLYTPYRFDIARTSKIAKIVRGAWQRFIPGAMQYTWN